MGPLRCRSNTLSPALSQDRCIATRVSRALSMSHRGPLGAQVGGEVVHTETGGTVLVPRGARHTFWNDSDESACVLELFTPAGLEQWFFELAEIGTLLSTVDRHHRRTRQLVTSCRQRDGLRWLRRRPPLRLRVAIGHFS
jgi:hypothetical protein